MKTGFYVSPTSLPTNLGAIRTVTVTLQRRIGIQQIGRCVTAIAIFPAIDLTINQREERRQIRFERLSAVI